MGGPPVWIQVMWRNMCTAADPGDLVFYWLQPAQYCGTPCLPRKFPCCKDAPARIIPANGSWHQQTGIFPGYTVSLSHLGYSTRHDPIHVSALHDMHLKMWDLASSLMIWCIKFTVAHQIHPWITCSWSNALPHHFSLICGQIDRKHSQRTQRISCRKGGNNLKPFQERTGRCN